MKFLRYLKFIFPPAGAIIGFQVSLSALGGTGHGPSDAGAAIAGIAMFFGIVGALVGVIIAFVIHALSSKNVADIKCPKCASANITEDTTCRYCGAKL
jgi:Na+/melibiose symporter-like transporter